MYFERPLERSLMKTWSEIGENAGNQHFLLFPTMFSIDPKANFKFSLASILASANALNLDEGKFFWFWKGLKRRGEIWGKKRLPVAAYVLI